MKNQINKEKEFKLDDCLIKALSPTGEVISCKKTEMYYDAAEDIYWYQDKSLSDIQILDPWGNKQDKYKVY